MVKLRDALSRLAERIRQNRYRLDSDRFVDLVNQAELRYHEGGRSIVVGYESLEGGEIGLYPNQIGPWEPALPGDRVDEAERARIMDNVRMALALRGVKVADTGSMVSGEELFRARYSRGHQESQQPENVDRDHRVR
jgi:hypothetical protein